MKNLCGQKKKRLGPVVLYTQYCYKVWQYESAAKNFLL